MKLDVECMRYLTKDEYRVLTAVEMGMRNHELVPLELITSIAKLRHGGSSKIISNLLRYKLVAHEANNYNGYRLSYLGYDILALKALANRGKVVSVGKQIGVGKESDIFEAMDENGEEVVVKIHRLGRTSFRAVRRHRDYMNNKSKASWLYMSRLAAIKEFAFMQVLYANGFPTPVPMDQNRHVVVMNRIQGFPLAQIKAGKMEGAENVFNKCTAILKRLGQFGLVHCDFNEFNLMTDELGNVTLIDFPQMVSVTHPNAEELFARDMNCLIKFFAMKMHYVPPEEARIYLKDIVTDVNVYSAAISDNVGSQDDTLLLDYIKSGEKAVDEEEGEDGAAEEDGEEEEDDGIIIDDPQERIADIIRPETAEGRVLAAAEAATAAAAAGGGSDVSDMEDGEGDEGSDAEEDVDMAQEIRNRVQRERMKNSSRQSSKNRNSVKKRNKYGKVDRSVRADLF